MWLNLLIYCLLLAFELYFSFPFPRLKMNLLIFYSNSFRTSFVKCKLLICLELVKAHIMSSKTFFLLGTRPKILGRMIKLPEHQ